jgi:hypothetical protein
MRISIIIGIAWRARERRAADQQAADQSTQLPENPAAHAEHRDERTESSDDRTRQEKRVEKFLDPWRDQVAEAQVEKR